MGYYTGEYAFITIQLSSAFSSEQVGNFWYRGEWVSYSGFFLQNSEVFIRQNYINYIHHVRIQPCNVVQYSVHSVWRPLTKVLLKELYVIQNLPWMKSFSPCVALESPYNINHRLSIPIAWSVTTYCNFILINPIWNYQRSFKMAWVFLPQFVGIPQWIDVTARYSEDSRVAVLLRHVNTPSRGNQVISWSHTHQCQKW